MGGGKVVYSPNEVGLYSKEMEKQLYLLILLTSFRDGKYIGLSRVCSTKLDVDV